MKLYLFEPYDVLTFGGLRHFGAGETHVQKSSFPPPVMRFFHLFKRVYGVFLWKEGQLYLPFPADVLKERKKEKDYEVRILKLKDKGIPLLTGTIGAFESVGNAFISYQDFEGKYSKNVEDIKVHSPAEFISWEYRVGIGLERDRRTAKETLLYSQEFIRLEKEKKRAQIAVLAEEPWEDADRNLVGLGGERRLAFRKELDGKFFKEPVELKMGGTYKFYCTSHLFVEGGLKKGSELRIKGMRFELLWLFSGGSEYISGFAKPFVQMLKPGSVLLLKALDSGGLGCKVCQIEGRPQVNVNRGMGWDLENFSDRGWNSGILMEV